MPPSVLLLAGGLKEIPLPLLLHSLKDQKKTGVLMVSRDKVTKSVYFQDGNILFSTSSYPNDFLRTILLREGRINFIQFKRCDDIVMGGEKKEEAMLLGQGSIKPKDLFDLLRLQIRGIVLSLFRWGDAQYTFTLKALPQEMSIGINIDPDEVIKAGLYVITDIAWLMQWLPPLNAILLRNQQALCTDELVCSEEEKGVFGLIDNERTVQDILMRSETKPLASVQILNMLVATGIVSYRLVSAGQRFWERTPILGTAGSFQKSEDKRPKQEENEGGSTEESFPEESPEEHIKTILSVYENLSRRNYYEILGVSKDADTEGIKRAYLKMVKRYHPDRHTGETFSKVIMQIEEVFLAVRKSYDTLSDHTARDLYDRGLLKPSSSTPSQSTKNLLDRAEASLLANNFKNAIYFFEETIRLMPDGEKKSAVFLRYGQVLSNIPGQLHTAEDAFQNAAKLNPENVTPYLELGLIFKKAGLLQKATLAFAEALKRDPMNKIAIEEIGTLKGKGKK